MQVQMGPAACLELPQYLLEDIFSRLEDARDIARAQSVCKDFLDAGNNVQVLRLIVDNYHERARNVQVSPWRSRISGECHGGEPSSSQGMLDGEPSWGFKEQMVQILKRKHNLVQLRVEVEPKLQARTVPDDEKKRTDFWISDPCFWKKCLPSMKSTLEHLCIVDYGQQAFMRRSNIIKILSENCKILKTLDLRNMFIDTSDCEKMPSMVSLICYCVKVSGRALQDISSTMPKLQTLALRGVFGVIHGNLTFPDLRVLFLGLFTPANDLQLFTPKLEELQLKMRCPQKLHIRASALKYVAFNLDMMEPSLKVALQCIDGVQELLYAASSPISLSSFAEKRPYLEKFFLDVPCACVDQTLDVPCMAVLRDGRYADILSVPPFNILSRLHECGHPEVTPALWQWKQHIPDGLNLQMNVSRA